MTYELNFTPQALKTFKKLDQSIQKAFKKILIRRLGHPKIESCRLYGDRKNHYKIKLRQQGYRLIYQVLDLVIRQPRLANPVYNPLDSPIKVGE